MFHELLEALIPFEKSFDGVEPSWRSRDRGGEGGEERSEWAEGEETCEKEEGRERRAGHRG